MSTAFFYRPARKYQALLCALAGLLLAGGASAASLWPVISGTPPQLTFPGRHYSFTPAAKGPSGYALHFKITHKPAWASFNTSTGQLSGTPSATGMFADISIGVSDGVHSVSLTPFGIRVVNLPGTKSPTISGTPRTSATVGTAYTFTPTARGPAGDPVSFSIKNKPAWASFSIATGTLSGTPASANVGTDSDIVISASSSSKTASLAPFSIAVSAGVSNNPPPPPGNASLIFSFPSGVNGADSNFQTSMSATFGNGLIALSSSAFNPHQAGAAWYKTLQNIQSFTTDFTFQIAPTAYGITFCVQDTNSTTNPYAFGDYADGDANMLGYGAYDLANQWPLRNSIAIKFDLTAANGQSYIGATPSSTGLYLDGGPPGETGFVPEIDLMPLGINLHSGDVMEAHVVYDGSILTMVLRDTKTNAQARMSWPVDIPALTGSDQAWVGFTAGTIPNVSQDILTWNYWQGYNTELAAPTFSVGAGQYSSAQTVTISGPSGAAIYYTTNGQEPTTSSAQYSGPITVSSSAVVQAVAVENGYTDSHVATAYYQIVPNGAPVINFPNGFSGASTLIAATGDSRINGSNLQLTDTGNYSEVGAAWFASPVNVQNFTSSFMVDLTGPANANGFTFTIQNQNPASTDSASNVVSGGPSTLGMSQNGLGYQGMQSSVAIIFDLWDGSGNLVGLDTDGAVPSSVGIDMSSSGVSLHSGHPLAVTVAYNGTALTLTVKDTTTGASFTHSWANVDIPTIVGGDTAYVGFTGATGGMMALQDISSWTFSN